MTTFKNAHLSYSRLSRFAQCRLSFRLNYIDRLPSTPNNSLRFGKLVHAVLEALFSEHMDEERTGPFDSARVRELWRLAATAEGLTDFALFEEGLRLVETLARDEGAVDHRNILAIEKEFRLPVGRFEVLGFIDRVDLVDDETIRVVDYKTNRMLFTREEVDQSLQMSLYELAVRRLWPWVKNVDLVFVMLRHGVRLHTSRTAEQLQAALDYVESLGEQTESATEFPPTLNANCGYCDHRAHCPAYAAALAGERVPELADVTDLEAVGREREQVARLAKLLYGRKDELDDVLKAHLEHHDELVIGGVRYRLVPSKSLSYPAERVVPFLARLTGEAPESVHAKVASIDKKAVDELVKTATKSLDRSRARIAKAELEALADVTLTQRFSATEVKS
jgi:RecB family exonuclease